MDVYFWDFHGTLETGSEDVLAAAINEMRIRMGMLPDCTPEEIQGFYGPPLPEILKRYFPEHETDRLAREVNRISVTFVPRFMRLTEGAVDTMRTLRGRGHRN